MRRCPLPPIGEPHNVLLDVYAEFRLVEKIALFKQLFQHPGGLHMVLGRQALIQKMVLFLGHTRDSPGAQCYVHGLAYLLSLPQPGFELLSCKTAVSDPRNIRQAFIQGYGIEWVKVDLPVV